VLPVGEDVGQKKDRGRRHLDWQVKIEKKGTKYWNVNPIDSREQGKGAPTFAAESVTQAGNSLFQGHKEIDIGSNWLGGNAE